MQLISRIPWGRSGRSRKGGRKIPPCSERAWSVNSTNIITKDARLCRLQAESSRQHVSRHKGERQDTPFTFVPFPVEGAAVPPPPARPSPTRNKGLGEATRVWTRNSDRDELVHHEANTRKPFSTLSIVCRTILYGPAILPTLQFFVRVPSKNQTRATPTITPTIRPTKEHTCTEFGTYKLADRQLYTTSTGWLKMSHSVWKKSRRGSTIERTPQTTQKDGLLHPLGHRDILSLGRRESHTSQRHQKWNAGRWTVRQNTSLLTAPAHTRRR